MDKKRRVILQSNKEKGPNMNTQRPTRTWTPLKQAELDYAFATIHNYHILNRMRMAYFEPDGTVLTEENGKTYRRPGRLHLTRMINLFKSKDDSRYYKMCAVCKDILEEYDTTFAKRKGS